MNLKSNQERNLKKNQGIFTGYLHTRIDLRQIMVVAQFVPIQFAISNKKPNSNTICTAKTLSKSSWELKHHKPQFVSPRIPQILGHKKCNNELRLTTAWSAITVTIK